MSDTDSFIDEVSEEIRRDRLFKLMKRYGWIAVLLVIILVGGASYNELRKSRIRAEAQGFGDSILAALQGGDPVERLAALDEIAPEGDKVALLALVGAAQDVTRGAPEQAIERLNTIVSDNSLPQIYRQLAELKLVLLQGGDVPAAQRLARLEPLAVAGAPFRLLAEEQMAMVEISEGNTEAALARLSDILADGEVTAGLRRRVSQLIVALGGDLQPA